MLVKYFDGEIKHEFKSNEEIINIAKNTIDRVKYHFDKYETQEAGQAIMTLVDTTNKFVTDNAPWTLAKEEKMTECGSVLRTVLDVMCIVAYLIEPFCPNIAKSMAEQLSYDLNQKYEDLTLNNIKDGKLIEKEQIKPVFLRIDSEFADKTKK